MPLKGSLSLTCTRVLVALGITSLIAASGFAAPSQQVNMGPEDASKQISVTVWLNPHNKAGLDSLVQQMYDKTSPNYHKFLTMKEFKTQFAPTAKDAVTVRDYLASHNMNVMSIDKNNHFIVAQGRVGDMQTAFHTQINRVKVNGRMRRATTSRPSVTGPASAVISTVQGLSDLSYQAYAAPAKNPQTGVAYPGVSLAEAGPDGIFFSADCLRPPQTVSFNTGGTTPKATYTGNRYGADINSTPP